MLMSFLFYCFTDSISMNSNSVFNVVVPFMHFIQTIHIWSVEYRTPTALHYALKSILMLERVEPYLGMNLIQC